MTNQNSFNADNSAFSRSYQVPTDFVELPSEGIFYSEKHSFHKKKEIEVRYMTTREEDIITNISFIERGIMVDRLIESLCVDNIKASTLLSGDKNAILINARKNSYGEDYKIIPICINCGISNEVVVDLNDAVIKKASKKEKFSDRGSVFITLPITKVVVEAKIMTGDDVLKITSSMEQKKKHGLEIQPVIERYRHIILSINDNDSPLFINEFVTKMPIKDSRFFRKEYDRVVPDINLIYKFECSKCEHSNKGGIPLTGEFFWPDD